MLKNNKLVRFFFSLFLLSFVLSIEHANAEQKIAIVPFKVFGAYEIQYLKDALPEMFFSRLNFPNKEVVSKETLKSVLKDVDAKDEAKQAQYFLSKTDFTCLIMGAYTKMGDAFSLDVKVIKKDDREFKTFFVAKDKESKIFEAVSELSDKVTAYISGGKSVEVVQIPLTPVAEQKGFKRVKTFDTKAPLYGIALVDTDGKGNKVLAVASYSSVHIYSMDGDRLNLLQTLELKGQEILAVNAGDFNKNGSQELYVTAINLEDAVTYVYEKDSNGKFQQLTKTDWYIKVFNHPELGEILTGQRMGANDAFTGEVYLLDIKSSGIFAKSKLETPREFNLYQFTPIKYKNAPAFAHFDEADFLKIINAKGKLLERLKERYDGSMLGVIKGFDEMTREKKFTGLNSRIVRLENADTDIILTIKNDGSRLFSRSKKFDRGVIAALVFDGVSYKELLTSELIDGYVSDFTVDLSKSLIYVSVVTDNKEGRIFVLKLEK